MTEQDKELPSDEIFFSRRALYQMYSCDTYRSPYSINKMMNSVGIKRNTNYTWFVYYFRKYTINSILLNIGNVILQGLEFISFETTMDKKVVFVTTDKESFFFLTGYGKFKILKEKSHCENFLLLHTKDWEYLVGLDYFSRKLEALALENKNGL